MILFLEYSAGGVRGGELYNARFHRFIKSRYDIFPEEIPLYPRELKNPIKHCKFSLKLVKKKKPDLIAFDVSSGIRNLLALRWMKKNRGKSLLIVQEERINLRWDNFLAKWLVRESEKYLVRNTDIFVVNSRYSADLVKKKGARAKAPIVIAHPGLENITKETDYSSYADRPESEDFNLLFVGICKKSKGVIYLVKALNKLKKFNLSMNIVGQYFPESRYYKKIQRYLSRNNLQDRVIFHGFVERQRLLELYQKSHLYVHPSLMEGYGMVLAEAMSHGLPLVCTSAGAIPEIVEDGINGFLVKPGDAQGLALAIMNLLENKEIRQTISANNLEKAKNLNSWKDYDIQLEKELIPAIDSVTGLAI